MELKQNTIDFIKSHPQFFNNVVDSLETIQSQFEGKYWDENLDEVYKLRKKYGEGDDTEVEMSLKARDRFSDLIATYSGKEVFTDDLKEIVGYYE